MPVAQSKPDSKIRHEEFCMPRPGEAGPRVESYPYLADDVASGRSRPVATVTRCIECGATHYDHKEK